MGAAFRDVKAKQKSWGVWGAWLMPPSLFVTIRCVSPDAEDGGGAAR
jgi:hypothetical protein